MLAALGASVVVNDLERAGGSEPEGLADAVVSEIVQAGGRATVCYADVSDPGAGQRIVDAAIAEYGRVDALVHNAGIPQLTSFSETPIGQVQRVLAVNLTSAWYVGQAAWAQMVKQDYGRLVFTSSASILGYRNNAVYMAAKAGLVGLVKGLSAESDELPGDLRANALMPLALTEMSSQGQDVIWAGANSADAVAPVASWLASPQCHLNGRVLMSGASHLSELRLEVSRGWSSAPRQLTFDDVDTHLEAARDFGDSLAPESTFEYIQHVYRTVLGREYPIS
jgi:NAD(P)-dependent dehydrogenase (short-subunit alcohol dehydrogenase family)